MSDRFEKIEALVLEVLSFYEPMSLELILLDMPEERIAEIPDFNREELEDILKKLKKESRITSSTVKKETYWIKKIPRKSLLKRFLSRLKL